jgi:hypothetical protein
LYFSAATTARVVRRVKKLDGFLAGLGQSKTQKVFGKRNQVFGRISALVLVSIEKPGF